MNTALKIALYAICVALAAFFGAAFVKAFSARMDLSAQRFDTLPGATESTPARGEAADTNEAVESAEPAGPAGSNAVTAANSDTSTHSASASANLATPVEPTNRPPAASGRSVAARPAAEPSSHLGMNAALALAGVLGLALLIARDVSHWAAQRTHQFLYNEEGKGVGDPMYEQAEQTWANGDHLEAIRLLREYLARHPRELHARLRIAEIYEKDLNNPLAAALEYEDTLAVRFDPDRWGWAAIHLCNLYARLNQPAKMDEWMQRVVNEVPQTAAARKAREKLGLPEDYQPAAASSVEAAPDDTGLPPGFRPKKG